MLFHFCSCPEFLTSLAFIYHLDLSLIYQDADSNMVVCKNDVKWLKYNRSFFLCVKYIARKNISPKTAVLSHSEVQYSNGSSNFRLGVQGHLKSCLYSTEKKGIKDEGACVRHLYKQSRQVCRWFIFLFHLYNT